jgi:hypothetical protein
LRLTVLSNKEAPGRIRANCLGRCVRESGQSLDPMPPHRMILVILLFSLSRFYQPRYTEKLKAADLNEEVDNHADPNFSFQ